MSPAFYYTLHAVGIILVFIGLGGAIVRSAGGGEKCRKVVSITLGVGLLVILVAGFGLKAKLQIVDWPGWLIAKLVIWLALGALLAVINRKPSAGFPLWILVIILGTAAVYLVQYKPF